MWEGFHMPLVKRWQRQPLSPIQHWPQLNASLCTLSWPPASPDWEGRPGLRGKTFNNPPPPQAAPSPPQTTSTNSLNPINSLPWCAKLCEKHEILLKNSITYLRKYPPIWNQLFLFPNFTLLELLICYIPKRGKQLKNVNQGKQGYNTWGWTVRAR